MLCYVMLCSHFAAADGGGTVTACEVVCFTFCVLHILLIYWLLQMEAGQYCTFVIHRDGAVSACGKGSYGRLGLGTSSSQPAPCRLTFDQCRTFRHVSSSKGSDGHTLAVTVDGRVYSWGDGKPNLDDSLYFVLWRECRSYNEGHSGCCSSSQMFF